MKKTLVLAILFSIVTGCSSFSHTVDNHQHITRKFLYNSPRPTVIIVHGCDGVDNPSYNEWAKEVHSWGYNAVVADSFKFRGYHNGVCGNPPNVLPATRASELIKLAEYIRTQSWHEGKIAVIGFSHGGSTALNIANTKQDAINAAIAYYPSCLRWFSGLVVYDPVIPTQVHLAGRDDWTPAKECDYLPSKEKHLYEYATHAFDMNYPNRVYLGHTMAYDKKSDTLARSRTKDFLSTTLK